MRGRHNVLVAAGVTLAVAAPASAGGIAQFTTPTRNVGCISSQVDGDPVLRCDIREFSYTPPRRPAGCALDFGDSFTLREDGPARWTCHGDTALPPPTGRGFRTIRYGTTWSAGPFSCTSRVTAMECRSDAGHGFRLSRLKAARFQVRADDAQPRGFLG